MPSASEPQIRISVVGRCAGLEAQHVRVRVCLREREGGGGETEREMAAAGRYASLKARRMYCWHRGREI